MIDNDVAGLPTALSNDPVTSFITEPVAGVTGESGVFIAFGDEIGDTRGNIRHFSVKPHASETHLWYQNHSPPAPGWATNALTTTRTPETPEGEMVLPGPQPGTRP